MLRLIKILASHLLVKIKKPIARYKNKKFVKKEIRFISDLLPAKKSDNKFGTLIVKCDDIGDYIVWQATFEQYIKYEATPVFLIGNIAWQSLFEKLNPSIAITTLWIDKGKWKDINYRKEIYATVSNWNVKRAITPLFTRNSVIDDLIVYSAQAAENIAWQNNLYSDKFFNKLIQFDEPVMLEYYRNIDFVNKLYSTELPYKIEPLLSAEKRENILVVFPMANSLSRCWGADNYTKVIDAVKDKFDTIALMGGKDAVETCSAIALKVNSSKVVNQANACTLFETMQYINKSKIVLCPDTAALHMGVFTNTPVVAISNGSNANRFVHYPKGVKALYPSYFKLNTNKERTFYSRKEIQLISTERAITALLESI